MVGDEPRKNAAPISDAIWPVMASSSFIPPAIAIE